MTVKEIKEIAVEKGIIPGKMKKNELIRAIQNAEGNNPCYQTFISDCDQYDCCWKEDCLD